MINTIYAKIASAQTEGFNLTSNGLSIEIQGGSITFFGKDEPEIFTFEGFTFDVVPDDELPTLYDIFLCGDNTVLVNRTELLPDTIPSYSGEKELLHLLVTFNVPPSTVTLEGVQINVRLLELVVEEERVGDRNAES